MKSSTLVLMALAAGLMLALAWPVNGFPALLFVAFVPLLFIEQHFWYRKDSNSVFSLALYVLIAFFTWNLLTTYWIKNSSFVGAVVAVGLNSIFMTAVFTLFHATRRRLKHPAYGRGALVAYWITFELIHHHWDLNWPWLSLGNGFASRHTWIQWYEYTGVFGGTLWVLLVNILVFRIVGLIQNRAPLRQIVLGSSWVIALILVPIVISLVIYQSVDTEEGRNVEVVVVQPNLDPYSEQYELPPLEIVGRMWDLARKELSPGTRFVVTPESAIQEYVWEEDMNQSPSIVRFREYLQDFPNTSLVAGLSTRRMLDPELAWMPSARKFGNTGMYYEAFNTAILFDTSQYFQLYHKSKLTPGVEVMPLARHFRFIEKLALDLGGTVGSLGTDKVRKPFITPDGLNIGIAICYESVYGEFMSGYVRNGANLIFVITNDGWWGTTPGHRQHLLFSSLRAIELRRSVARSANTGISCFVNKRGDIQQPTAYWTRDVIKEEIRTGEKITLYARFGDYIARIAAFTSVLLLMISLMQVIKNRTSPRKQ